MVDDDDFESSEDRILGNDDPSGPKIGMVCMYVCMFVCKQNIRREG